MTDDSDLRARFASLRTEEARRTPAFRALLRRRREPSAAPRTGLRPVPVALAAAIAAAGLLVIAASRLRPSHELVEGSDPRRAPIAVPALADWRAPTDFLLETPGTRLLRYVPQIGSPAAGAGRSDRDPHSSDFTPNEEHRS